MWGQKQNLHSAPEIFLTGSGIKCICFRLVALFGECVEFGVITSLVGENHCENYLK